MSINRAHLIVAFLTARVSKCTSYISESEKCEFIQIVFRMPSNACVNGLFNILVKIFHNKMQFVRGNVQCALHAIKITITKRNRLTIIECSWT